MNYVNSFQGFIDNFFVFTNNNPPKNKIVIGSGIKGLHYTIHLGVESGYMDLHKTNEKTGEHCTLFKIKREDCIKITDTLTQYLPTLLLTVFPRVISLSVLNRNKWHLIPFYEQSNDYENFVELKRNRFKFSRDFNFKNFYKTYLFPNEIHSSDDSLFLVYGRKHEFKGIIKKVFKDTNSDTLFFINKISFSYLINSFSIVLLNIVNSLDIEEKKIILKHISNIVQDLCSEFSLN